MVAPSTEQCAALLADNVRECRYRGVHEHEGRWFCLKHHKQVLNPTLNPTLTLRVVETA